MFDLLLELFSEEIPARMQRRAADDMKDLITKGLLDAGLTYKSCHRHWTPRRLTLDLRGLSECTAEIIEERKGPRTNAPKRAIQGFLDSVGLTSIDDVEVRADLKKGSYFVAVVRKPGQAAENIIAELVPKVVRNFPWAKSQRWGSGTLRWVRPLRSILCSIKPVAAEPKIIAFDVDGIHSGNFTFGHRFLAPESIVPECFTDYRQKLKVAKVVLDAEQRKEMIRSDANNLAYSQGLELVEDPNLVEEVSGLVEFPVTLMGEFAEAYLVIPDEVIRLTIKQNQKCFVLRDNEGLLSNKFIVTSNIEAIDGGSEIINGNQRVINARLSDAKFFLETDLAVVRDTNGFENWVKKLDTTTFHTKIGTLGQRVGRIKSLAKKLCKVTEANVVEVDRAAHLAKADLNSSMVCEFPDLQGTMGRIYAEKIGEPTSVARAIEEHYYPQGPNSSVPFDPVTVTVALADKLDVLISFWAINETPTGSKDPFALRRAALGVTRLIIENALRVHLQDFGVSTSLLSFLQERLKNYLRKAGVRYDVIQAVLKPGNDDFYTTVQRIKALAAFLDTSDGLRLSANIKRVKNISEGINATEKCTANTINPNLFKIAEEKNLYNSLRKTEEFTGRALEKGNYAMALQSTAEMNVLIDQFFKAVMVNSSDPTLQANRIALMNRISLVGLMVADFSKLKQLQKSPTTPKQVG